MTPRATIDYETRSTCSIRTCGSWRYALDPTTEVLCLAFRLPHWDPGMTGLWHPAFPHLGIEAADDTDLRALFAWITNGYLVEAHNCFFERGIWTHISVPQHGWPRIAPHQWRCSAAKAAAHALPRALAGAADALCLDIRKDAEGAKTMRKMVSPRTPTKSDWQRWGRQVAPCAVCAGTGRVGSLKKDGTASIRGVKCDACLATGVRRGATLPPMPTLYHESRELLEALWAYCRIDVLTEEALSHALPDLSPAETALYLLDQEMNERGFAIDRGAVEAALALIEEESVDLNAELAALTAGAVTKATQRAKMLAWLAEQGLDLDDSQADTLDAELEKAHPPHVHRTLEVVRTLGKSSTAKYVAMQHWQCPDARVHGGLIYHGASTGRWTGSGVQPHNFPRGGTIKTDQDTLWDYLQTQDRALITETFGSVMTALSEGLRGAIVAGPDRRLYVADFNAIEPRTLFWLAGDTDALDVFRSGRDIYNDFGTTELYRRPIDRKQDLIEGVLCKAAILGLGYGMGAKKFVETAMALGQIALPEDHTCLDCGEAAAEHRDADHEAVIEDPSLITATVVVQAYRRKYWKVPLLWKTQERAAIQAVQTRRPVTAGVITWHVERQDIANSFLYATLPSGRRLAYPGPSLAWRRTPWGAKHLCLRYYEINQFNRQWQPRDSYGGLLVENLTQAVARDLMAEATRRIAQDGVFCPVLTVHDELIAEGPKGLSVDAFEAEMALVPDWAPGLPVVASGYAAYRYRKG